MKIIRNGIEYELTEQELFEAYCEKEHEYDIEDLKNVCEVNGYDLTDEEKKIVIEKYRDGFESEGWFDQLSYWCETVIYERKEKVYPDNIEEAKKLIDEYCLEEFECQADFTNMEEIGVCYTTMEDDNEEIQVYVDLINYNIRFYINGELKHTERYGNLDDFIEQELKYMDFDDLYFRACDYMEDK